VDIYVDNTPLTLREACNDAVFYKLPIQKAKLNPLEINDLRLHRLLHEFI